MAYLHLEKNPWIHSLLKDAVHSWNEMVKYYGEMESRGAIRRMFILVPTTFIQAHKDWLHLFSFIYDTLSLVGPMNIFLNGEKVEEDLNLMISRYMYLRPYPKDIAAQTVYAPQAPQALTQLKFSGYVADIVDVYPIDGEWSEAPTVFESVLEQVINCCRSDDSPDTIQPLSKPRKDLVCGRCQLLTNVSDYNQEDADAIPFLCLPCKEEKK